MGEPLTMGMIGCGSMAGAHLSSLRILWEAGLGGFRFVATCDTTEAAAAKMADDLAAIQGVRPAVYTDVERMLHAERGMAAVDVCTVHRAHHTVAVPCLEAGKHVTIEKPLAITMRAGRLMLDAAEKTGVVLQVAENYRRSPEQRAIRWAIKSGRIGQVRMVYWIDVGERIWYWTWREHRAEAGGGWPLDGGVHSADLFRYHVGDVREVFCEVRSYLPVRYRDPGNRGDPVPVDVEDTTMATLRFDGDALGQWISTSAAPGIGFNERAIYGSEGCVHLGQGLKRIDMDEPLSLEDLTAQHQAALSTEERERLYPRGVTDEVATELWEFVRACLTGGTVETDGWAGYRAEAICMALYESHAVHAPVQVKDVEELRLEEYQRDLNESLGLA